MLFINLFPPPPPLPPLVLISCVLLCLLGLRKLLHINKAKAFKLSDLKAQ